MLFRMLFQLSFSVDSKDVWWYSNHVSVFLWSFILPLAKQASLISNHYMPGSKMSQACSVSRNSLSFCCCSELLAFCSWEGIFFSPFIYLDLQVGLMPWVFTLILHLVFSCELVGQFTLLPAGLLLTWREKPQILVYTLKQIVEKRNPQHHPICHI